MRPTGSLFVTGTDTDVGKTVVAAALTLGLDACYWKPIQAGHEPSTDTDTVRRWTGLPGPRFIPEAYRLRAAMSPHAAAALEGVEIDVARIVNTELPPARPVVIEGAGGLMVPLHKGALMVDLIGELRVPVILVARTGLGTLNHTLLSVSEMRRRSIPLVGVVLNGEEHESNRRAIEEYGDLRVLGRVPPLGVVDAALLRSAFGGLDLP
ncbi:MAG: dethiobiotin synthase [Gemmatimonadota bacterium]|nr:dethiobiotin synthase [Gemmatimonadota bacterium]